MNYDFPIITRIEDVLPHIEGFDEIIVAEREGYKVINYMVSTPRLWERSHGWEVRRECRGLIFDDEGRLISRPFHKFFNLGEKEETLPNNVDVTELHHILDKMDGSMGGKSNNDWIVDPVAQAELTRMIDDICEYLYLRM